MKIAFIGYGEAAQAFGASLSARDAELRFAAYDILLDGEGLDGPCAALMRQHGVEAAPSATEAVLGADWTFSAVTADQSLAAVESVATSLRRGQILFDINSVSPERKRASAALLPIGVYVDMAVMAPVHPDGHATPVLLAGPVPEALGGQLSNLCFRFEIAGTEAGAATAIKMVRSLFVKGLEAITVETLLAAEASGCLPYILASLGKSYPGLGFPDIAIYQFERTLKHGRRRAAEMRESAVTLDDLGLHGALAGAIADVQQKMGQLGHEPAAEGDVARIAAKALLARRG